MQLQQEKSTLVIAGSFNPAILVPPWFAKNVLGKPEGENFPVQVQAPLASVVQAPRFTFLGISFTPSFQSLTFHLQDLDPAASQGVCESAATLLQRLPHTPVLGVGFNFTFLDAAPSAQLLQTFQPREDLPPALGEGAQVVAQSWSNLVSWGNSLVKIKCERKGNEVTLELNFHYSVKDATSGEAVLRKDNVFALHKDAAQRVAATLGPEG